MHTTSSQKHLASFNPANNAGKASPVMNNLEARIRQRQSERAKGLIEDSELQNRASNILEGRSQAQAIASPVKPQQPSQLVRLTGKLTQLDDRLQEAKTLTDTKFNQLNEQMGVIQDFIDEDREFREQLRKIRKDEIK